MSYSTKEVIELVTELKKLGVYRFKTGDLELELVPPQSTPRDLAPEETEQALKAAHEELQRELEGAS